MKALLMLHKMAVLAQARAILEDNPIESIDFVYPTEGGKISERMIRSSLAPWLENRSLRFHPLNFFRQISDFQRLVQSEPWDIAAFPLVGGRPFYQARRMLPRATRFFVISDGSCECSSLWNCYQRVRIRSCKDYLAALVMLADVRRDVHRNEAYSLFHPLPSCFAGKTYPAQRLPVPKERETVVRSMPLHAGPVDYVVQGYGVAYEDCIRKFSLENPVTTVKRPLDSEDFVAGEDIIDVLQPRRIIGYCCDVLMYARKFSPESECIAIMDPKTDRQWGHRHNATFRKQAALLGGMRFISYDAYLRL